MRTWKVVVSCLLLSAYVIAQDPGSMTPKSLRAMLETKPQGNSAEQLAGQIRNAFGGKENLVKGAAPKVDELDVAWAIEIANPSASPAVVSDPPGIAFPLVRVGSTDVYAAVASLPNGTAMRWNFQVGNSKVGGGQLEVYTPHPDSLLRSGVLQGQLKQMPKWQSNVFAGTSREWWIYVPTQYKADSPACVMVFQDGGGYKDFVPPVFDNLIAKGDMPVTIGIFLQPGIFGDGKSNRSFEYDTLSDQYARFLLEEILPETEKTLKLRHDPESRAIAGLSSGGICAFTVAWERPKEFGKVLSSIGSFTNIASGPTLREGGHNYPALIRKTPKKPIRIFLQEGENDLDNLHGSWPLANHQMEKALAFSGYDYKMVWGQGFHSNKHGKAILPDSLRWLWRDYRP